MSRELKRVLGIGLYVILVFLPLILMLAFPGPAERSIWREISVGLGFVGLALAGLQLLPTARFAFFSDVFDFDTVYVVHHRLAVLSVLLVLLHPIILLAYNPYVIYLLNPLRAPWRAVAGFIGLAGLILIGFTSVLRRQVKMGYRFWHYTHFFLSLIIATFALIHLFEVDYYLAAPGMKAAWSVEAAIWGGGVLYVRVIRPWRVSRRPYAVERVERETADVWSMYIRPEGHRGLEFRAGQIAWLNINSSPFSVDRNPFSVSNGANQEALRFSIQVVGDFTSQVPTLEEGDAVYVDGPYGTSCVDEATDAEGFALIAGGIGAAPVMGILHSLAHIGDPRPVYLFYGNYDWENVAFAREIQELEDALKLHTIYALVEPPEGFTGVRGFITTKVLDENLPANRRRLCYFVCGPPGMIESVKISLQSLHIPKGQTTIEEYEMA